jgi:hypothetical protein
LKFLSNTDLKTLELKCKENKEVEWLNNDGFL